MRHDMPAVGNERGDDGRPDPPGCAGHQGYGPVLPAHCCIRRAGLASKRVTPGDGLLAQIGGGVSSITMQAVCRNFGPVRGETGATAGNQARRGRRDHLLAHGCLPFAGDNGSGSRRAAARIRSALAVTLSRGPPNGAA